MVIETQTLKIHKAFNDIIFVHKYQINSLHYFPLPVCSWFGHVLDSESLAHHEMDPEYICSCFQSILFCLGSRYFC